MVSYTLSLAVAEIVTVRVAATSAQGNHPRIWRALNGGVAVLLLLLSPLVALFWLFPEWVVVLFIGSEVRETQTLLPLASSLIVLIGLFVITDGLRIVGS
uniref:MatE protein n=1 Tax=Candidatus Kentrum sp. LPFa TaxID=2126335 RepID=A0A450W678_9GAMM|nr:MAG: MatE protein [Candidatus Kentron sp. LPFa]VFK28740.1 MAG: MatE protein [Candidatus Kentron sp. LPFa]